MISLWMREIGGWCLVALSMIVARMVLLYVANRQVVEAGILVVLTLGILSRNFANSRCRSCQDRRS